MDNTRWNDFSLIFVLCPKWQFKMKNTGFGKSAIYLIWYIQPKRIHKLWKVTGIKDCNPFSLYYYLSIFYELYVFCLPPLFAEVSVLFKNCLFFIWAEWTPCTETVYIIIILYKHHLFIFMNLNYCTFLREMNIFMF